jgi:hypothetical protein
MTLGDWLLGRHLATREEEHQRVGVLAGIPMLGLAGVWCAWRCARAARSVGR